eukprot:2799142-Pleurochrysis_carterae.AAC.1
MGLATRRYIRRKRGTRAPSVALQHAGARPALEGVGHAKAVRGNMQRCNGTCREAHSLAASKAKRIFVMRKRRLLYSAGVPVRWNAWVDTLRQCASGRMRLAAVKSAGARQRRRDHVLTCMRALDLRVIVDVQSGRSNELFDSPRGAQDRITRILLEHVKAPLAWFIRVRVCACVCACACANGHACARVRLCEGVPATSTRRLCLLSMGGCAAMCSKASPEEHFDGVGSCGRSSVMASMSRDASFLVFTGLEMTCKVKQKIVNGAKESKQDKLEQNGRQEK